MKPRKPTQQELEDIFATNEKGIHVMREIDEPLEWFKDQMKKKLRVNDHKGGWKNCSMDELVNHLYDEFVELCDAVFNNEPLENVIFEAADVGNFSMMIADIARKIIKEHEKSVVIDV